MRLLLVHKILIASALGLGVILCAWGVVHGLRGQRGAFAVAALGAASVPLLALYLRKLKRNPPIR